MSGIVEFVPEIDTLADITIRETQDTGLRTSNAIIITALLISACILNLVIIVTVFASSKLRDSCIYLLFIHFSTINLVNLFFTILISLIYIANGAWVMGIFWCRVNAMIQEFCQLYTLMSLMLMCAERAVGSLYVFAEYDHMRIQTPNIFTGTRLAVFCGCLFTACLAIAVPISTTAIPVKPFRNRYVCAIDSGCPIGYPIARAIFYCGGLIVILVCIGALFRKKREGSRPSNPNEYSEFIKRNRIMDDYMRHSRCVVWLLVFFILLEGPYICLSFIYEIANSKEILQSQKQLEIPMDADTLITWLKFVFPLLSPILILCHCSDIWLKVKELYCCSSSEPASISQYMGGGGAVPGVMTLVATSEGLQLRMPVISPAPYQHHLTAVPTIPHPTEKRDMSPPTRRKRSSLDTVESLERTNETLPTTSRSDEPIASTSHEKPNPAKTKTTKVKQISTARPGVAKADQPRTTRNTKAGTTRATNGTTRNANGGNQPNANTAPRNGNTKKSNPPKARSLNR